READRELVERHREAEHGDAPGLEPDRDPEQDGDDGHAGARDRVTRPQQRPRESHARTVSAAHGLPCEAMCSRRRGASVLAVVVAAIALTGCAARPAAMPGPWRAPEPAPPVDPVTAYAEARLAGMTLEQKVASMLMVHVGGTDASAIGGVIDAHGLAGTIFFADNVPGSASGLARISGALSSDPDLPVLIAIDQEGG